jgi:hypothetical protein
MNFPIPTTQQLGQYILDFLDHIEGAGYGGMAEYEIARSSARDLTAAAQSSPTRDEMARTLWRHRRHYTPTDDQLRESVTGRDCFADVDAILALAVPSTACATSADEPANDYIKDDGQFGVGA